MTDEQKIDATVDDKAPNGADLDNGAIAAAAAQSATAPQPLDPSRPMFHLIPPLIMQDTIQILKRLPYEDVARVMPALMQAEIHQAPPGS